MKLAPIGVPRFRGGPNIPTRLNLFRVRVIRNAIGAQREEIVGHEDGRLLLSNFSRLYTSRCLLFACDFRSELKAAVANRQPVESKLGPDVGKFPLQLLFAAQWLARPNC